MLRRDGLVGPVSMLVGGIIGAGIFSLPYVINQAGLFAGLFLLVLSTIAYCFIHLMYADLILGTAGQHRFVGYVGRYLGRLTSYLAILMAVVEMVFVLVIYLILSVSFIYLICAALSPFYAILIFWLVSSVSIFSNLKRFVWAEVLASVGIITVISLIFFSSLPKIERLFQTPVLNNGGFLFPLSAILFALSGRVAIPPLINYLRNKNTQSLIPAVRRSVIYGTVIPAVMYAIFVVAVLALSPTVSSDAVTGIIGAIPGWLAVLVGVLGLLSLWSSYILVGLDVGDTLRYDLNLPFWFRVCIVVVVPPALYLVGFTNFIELVGLVGGVFLAFEGFFILSAWIAARTKGGLAGLVRAPLWVVIFLLFVFGAALFGVLKG